MKTQNEPQSTCNEKITLFELIFKNKIIFYKKSTRNTII